MLPLTNGVDDDDEGGGGGGGGGFFLACEDVRRIFDHSYPAYVFCFFFKWRVARAH